MGWFKKKKKESEQTLDAREALRQIKRSKKGLSREETAQIIGVVCEQVEELKRQIFSINCSFCLLLYPVAFGRQPCMLFENLVEGLSFLVAAGVSNSGDG